MLTAWLTSSLVRHHPALAAKRSPAPTLRAPRGGRCSLQAAFVVDHGSAVEVSCRVEVDGGLSARVRRVGVVPVPHANVGMPPRLRDGRGALPGFVPDPLFDESVARAAPGEPMAFWISLEVPPDAKPGRASLRVVLTPQGGKPVTLRAAVEVSPLALAERRDFPVTHWFHVDCLADRYGLEPYSERFWPLCEAYVRDYAAHGSDMLYVPVFAPPLDGVRKPSVQLLRVSRDGGRWRFDWSMVERWIAMAKRCGIRGFEWTHLFTQWGADRAIRVYDAAGSLWAPETPASSNIYRGFLAAFLPELQRFVDAHGVRDASIFHISAEPHDQHLENYRVARRLVGELAPWMRITEALSDVDFARAGLVDQPVPILSKVADFARAGIPCWAYYCCFPRGKFLNRLLDTPLPWVAMHGFLLHRLGSLGFLHWGYNYWYRSQTTELIDPFTVSDGGGWPGWAHGDTFVVYPGKDGPIDSMRWEIFAEALQDLALLRQLGVPRDAAWLREVRAFDRFPREERWITAARTRLLRAKARKATRG